MQAQLICIFIERHIEQSESTNGKKERERRMENEEAAESLDLNSSQRLKKAVGEHKRRLNERWARMEKVVQDQHGYMGIAMHCMG